MKNLKDISLAPLENAVNSLKQGLAAPPQNDLERDGIIQRFEFTFELCWKNIRRVLIILGKKDVSGSPKPILRDGFSEGLISDVDQWFKFLEIRNSTSHIYNAQEAEKTYRAIQQFLPYALALVQSLKKHLQK